MEIITILEKIQNAIYHFQIVMSFVCVLSFFLEKERSRSKYRTYALLTIINIVCCLIIEVILRSY